MNMRTIFKAASMLFILATATTPAHGMFTRLAAARVLFSKANGTRFAAVTGLGIAGIATRKKAYAETNAPSAEQPMTVQELEYAARDPKQGARISGYTHFDLADTAPISAYIYRSSSIARDYSDSPSFYKDIPTCIRAAFNADNQLEVACSKTFSNYGGRKTAFKDLIEAFKAVKSRHNLENSYCVRSSFGNHSLSPEHTIDASITVVSRDTRLQEIGVNAGVRHDLSSALANSLPNALPELLKPKQKSPTWDELREQVNK